MMGFGILVMLAVLALPILLTVGLVILMFKPKIGQNSRLPAINSVQTTTASNPRICSHCGAKRQPEWAHCPQCGAPV